MQLRPLNADERKLYSQVPSHAQAVYTSKKALGVDLHYKGNCEICSHPYLGELMKKRLLMIDQEATENESNYQL